MTGPEERALYENNRMAWAELVAPRRADLITGPDGAAVWLACGDEVKHVLTHIFAARLAQLQGDAKRALWDSLPEDVKEALRQMKAKEIGA